MKKKILLLLLEIVEKDVLDVKEKMRKWVYSCKWESI